MISNDFSGFLVHLLGTRVCYPLWMAFWTTAWQIHAFADTSLQFGICRFMSGIGEAGNWPAAIKLTAELFPPHEMSTASGIFTSGSGLGSVIVPTLIAYLGISYCWQATFIILAVCGYLWLVIFWFLYYTPKEMDVKVKTFTIPPLNLLNTRFVLMFTLSKPLWIRFGILLLSGSEDIC